MPSKFGKVWKGCYRERAYKTPLSTARFVPEQYELELKLKYVGYF
jgi:hypothetical protein